MMNKTALTATHAANAFNLKFDRLSRLAAMFSGLVSQWRSASVPDTISLSRGRLRYVTKPRGRQVTCITGAIWLTFDGEPQDIVLEAGESYRCASRARLGISAFEPATVQID